MEGAQRAPFGETLATFRTKADLSQQQLADQLGKTRRAVAAWEAGEYLPKAKGDVLSIARILKLDDEETTILLTAAGMDPLLSLWNVPYHRNPYFTGRDELLKQLDQYLAPQSRMAPAGSRRVALTQPHAVTGLGGIGKTQIAVEYAYRSSELGRYTHTFWVNAANTESILASFMEIAALLPAFAARNETDQSKLIEAVKRWLEQCKQPWLLIFDNVDHDEDLPTIPEYLPQRGYGSVLLTTRASAVGSLATSLEVETMGFVEGAQFLLRRAHRVANAFDLEHASDEEINLVNRAGNIVQILDHFPLALDQAGAYIEETRCSFEEYLHLYQTHREELLVRRGKAATDYPDSVATTWSLSFQRVQQANPAAAELLHLCAFLAPDRIPEELIKESASHWPSLLQQAAIDPFAFDQMIADLLKFSLVKRLAEDHVLSIHRLVQAVQVDTMEPEVQLQWVERAIRAINAIFPDDPGDVAVWPQCLRYLDQAQMCYESVEHFGLASVEAANILNRTGIYLALHAIYTTAERLYQHSLAMREKLLGATHPSTAQSLNNLAHLYQSQGKYSEAGPLYQRALVIREQRLGATHPSTAQSLNNLAHFYHIQGRYSEAEPLYQRALAIREQRLGREHTDTAVSLDHLAQLYQAQGRYSEAEPLYQQALAIYKHRLGAEHLSTAGILNNLAFLYHVQGRDGEGEPLVKQALAIREQWLGREQPDTAQSLYYLAAIYQAQGRYSEAEPLYQQALAIYKHWLGAEHPSTIEILSSLAQLYRQQGRVGEAELLVKQVLAIREQRLGREHPDTAQSLNSLATIYQVQGRYSEAELLYQQVLAIRKQLLGTEHPDTLVSLGNLAGLYHMQGRYSEAQPLYQQTLAIVERILGSDHPTTRTIRKNYTLLQDAVKSQREAES